MEQTEILTMGSDKHYEFTILHLCILKYFYIHLLNSIFCSGKSVVITREDINTIFKSFLAPLQFAKSLGVARVKRSTTNGEWDYEFSHKKMGKNREQGLSGRIKLSDTSTSL